MALCSRFCLMLLVPVCLVARGYEKIPYETFRTMGGNSYVKLSNGWTNYELCGDAASGHTVVLIHGGTIPLCVWNAQMQDFIHAGFRIVRYDQYGRGSSARPKIEYSRELFLRQLTELLDSLGITEPVTIVGPSFGAAIAVNFTSHYPERVKSLILVSPALNLINSDSPLAGSIKLLRTPWLGESLYFMFARGVIIRRGRALVPGGKGSSCDSVFRNQFACKGTRHALFSMFRSDAYGDYRELTRKAGKNIKNILLVRGKEDTEITEKMIAQIKDDIPAVSYVEIEKSGHNPGSDAARILNKMIIDYITSH